MLNVAFDCYPDLLANVMLERGDAPLLVCDGSVGVSLNGPLASYDYFLAELRRDYRSENRGTRHLIVSLPVNALSTSLGSSGRRIVARTSGPAHRSGGPIEAIIPDVSRLLVPLTVLAVGDSRAIPALHERHLAEHPSRVLDEIVSWLKRPYYLLNPANDLLRMLRPL